MGTRVPARDYSARLILPGDFTRNCSFFYRTIFRGKYIPSWDEFPPENEITGFFSLSGYTDDDIPRPAGSNIKFEEDDLLPGAQRWFSANYGYGQ